MGDEVEIRDCVGHLAGRRFFSRLRAHCSMGEGGKLVVRRKRKGYLRSARIRCGGPVAGGFRKKELGGMDGAWDEQRADGACECEEVEKMCRLRPFRMLA